MTNLRSGRTRVFGCPSRFCGVGDFPREDGECCGKAWNERQAVTALAFVRWILRWFMENLLFLLVWSLIVGSGGGIVVAIPDLWEVESRGILAFVSVLIGGTGLAVALRLILDRMKKAYEARQQKEREEEDARTRAEQQSMEFRKGVGEACTPDIGPLKPRKGGFPPPAPLGTNHLGGDPLLLGDSAQ